MQEKQDENLTSIKEDGSSVASRSGVSISSKASSYRSQVTRMSDLSLSQYSGLTQGTVVKLEKQLDNERRKRKKLELEVESLKKLSYDIVTKFTPVQIS